MRPVQLSLVPDHVDTMLDVSHALRHCDHVCHLLAAQTNFIKNSFYIRVSLIQHLFTHVIPCPLPLDDPNKSQCIWTQPMHYHLQIDILRSLHRVCRHFVTSSLSIQASRGLDATRTLTMACISAVADALVRVVASDVPSKFCMHLSGTAPGPSYPFGFRMGNMHIQSEFMSFTNPALVTMRTQALDYFRSIDRVLRPDHVMFDFGNSMTPGPVKQLLEQLCWDMGFDRSTDMSLYLSGDATELPDFYPELHLYRDIVFYFKLLMTPKAEALPEVRAWKHHSSELKWSFDRKTNKLQVNGFGRKLQCSELDITAEKAKSEEKNSGWFQNVKKVLVGEETRVPPSGADPTSLCKVAITTEEDVLHVADLPTFGGQLTQRNSELLISYLTAPYIRIPLLLAFFAREENIKALGHYKLQFVLDCALYEPSYWQLPPQDRLEVDLSTIKLPFNDNRVHFATPVGLLFNELQQSPDGILKSLTDILDIALDLETRTWSSATSGLILYVVRLLVRVQGYLSYLVKHFFWLRQSEEHSNTVTNSGWASHVRGLAANSRTVRLLEPALARVKKLLMGRVYSILERWCERCNLHDGQVQTACILRAHLAYLFKDVEASDLTTRTVSTLLSSQVFLTTRHTFSLDAREHQVQTRSDKKVSGDESWMEKWSLEIPDNEVFDLFQKHRAKIYNWLLENPDQANEVMESVVRVATLTGTRRRPEDSPANRVWVELQIPGGIGRFIPDNKEQVEALVKFDQNDTYEVYLRKAQDAQGNVDTEINLQLGDFTLRHSRLQILEDRYLTFPAMAQVFGNKVVDAVIQCAEVKNTSRREWYRLVGRRHDAILWTPPDDGYISKAVKDPVREERQLSAYERWMPQMIEPYVASQFYDQKILYPASTQPTDNVVTLTVMGLYEDPENALVVDDSKKGHKRGKSSKAELDAERKRALVAAGGVAVESKYTILKEVVLYRNTNTVHIYEVLEYGRRFYRSLKWSSNTIYVNALLKPKLVYRKEGMSISLHTLSLCMYLSVLFIHLFQSLYFVDFFFYIIR